MSDYASDLERFLRDLALQTRDAEISEEARRRQQTAAVEQHLALLVDECGFDREEILDRLKRSGKYKLYFADASDGS